MTAVQKTERTFNPDMKLFAIYPDYWKEKWGDKPVLGYVRAYDSFNAVRKAYDVGILRVNFTIAPVAVEVTDKIIPQRSRRKS